MKKGFLFFAMLSVLFATLEYGITRPVSQALFLTYWTSQMVPWVWLATVPLNLFIIFLYNRYLPRLGPLKTMGTLCAFTLLLKLLCVLFLSRFPILIFLHYAWKDIYILLILKQIWSIIHSTIPSQRAKYLYGFIFSMGALGSVLGSQIPAHLATQIGSEVIFLFSFPVYAGLLFAYRKMLAGSSITSDAFLSLAPRASEGFSLIRQSRALFTILTLVILMQVSIGLIEYQFSWHLETNILEKDLRTAYCGKLTGYMNLLNGLFQLVGGWFLVHVLGLKRSHFAIPVVLLASALLSWTYPSFALISFSYVFIKAIDFSLFGIVREMLYLPMALDEKFQAKAVIDVFAYRTSKAFVALALLSLQWLAGSLLLPIASSLSLGVFLAWILAVLFLFRERAPQRI